MHVRKLKSCSQCQHLGMRLRMRVASVHLMLWAVLQLMHQAQSLSKSKAFHLGVVLYGMVGCTFCSSPPDGTTRAFRLSKQAAFPAVGFGLSLPGSHLFRLHVLDPELDLIAFSPRLL